MNRIVNEDPQLEDVNSLSCDTMNGVLSMLSAQQAGVWQWDRKKDILISLNDFLSVTGLKEAGVSFSTMKGLREAIHPDDKDAFDSALGSVSSAPGSSFSLRYRFIGKDSREIWVDSSLYSQKDNIICCTINASKRKLQEDEIKRLEEKYHKLVNTLPDFIFVFDGNFVFQDIIMADNMSLLHSREELIGTSGRKIFTPEVSDLYENNIRDCIRTRQMKEIEYYLLIGDIKYYFQARIVPFEDNKVFALIRDIGDRVKRIEELIAARKRAEEADRQKSAFLANMSHEIRTPLNAIVGFTELVAAEDDPDLRAQYMDVIRNNNSLLLQLINDLLDLSRIESGKSEIILRNTDINKLVEDVVATHGARMKPGVELRADLPGDHIWTVTDHNRVTQVLFNLISNAVKNTDQGSITVKLALEEGHIRLSVTDTGCGIPADKLATIFERFEKVQDSSNGTGLGLSISRGLVERMGGKMIAESQLGNGSTFSFTLPYRQGGMELPENEYILQRKKVVVAEEQKENYEFIKQTLEQAYGVEVLWAENGEEAVNLFVIEKPDMVLMSIQLPVIDGIEATKRIRAISPDVPIIGMTTNAYYMEQQWAQENGCNDVLTKPLSASRLEEVSLAYM